MNLSLKQMVKQSIDSLPDDSGADDIIEHIRFLERIDRGLKQVEDGEFISHEEALKIINGERTLDN